MVTKPKQVDYDIAAYSRDAEDHRLVGAFADFLSLKGISGHSHSQVNRSVLSAEDVVDKSTTVEVMKDDVLQPDDCGTAMTFLVHRDVHNDIRSIEVLCSCGKRAVLALDYEESPDPTED